jgi:hypothetical protein
MGAQPIGEHHRNGRHAPWLTAVAMTTTLFGGALVDLDDRAYAAPPACWEDVPFDLDGGGPDVAIGMPSYDLPGLPDAGAIVVFSNVAEHGQANPKAPTARTLLTAGDFGLTPQAGARFGASVAVWPAAFDDADGCADLIVGAPGQNVGSLIGAGRVYQLAGAPGGLSGVTQAFDESSVSGGAQAGSGFGTALGVSGSSLLAVGAPGRDIGTASDAGRVVSYNYLLPGDPVVSVIQQGGTGAGSPEAGDRFGEVLDATSTGEGPIVFIGVPHEDVGSSSDAGAVAAKTWSGPLTIVTQDSPGAGGGAETGDRYGSSIDVYGAFTAVPVLGVAVGVPGEDVGGLSDAGSVAFAYLDLKEIPDPADTTGLIGQARVVTQDSPGMPGTAESGDFFGNAVLAGEFGHESGHIDLAVAAPLEDLSGEQNAGSISMAEYDVYGHLEPTNRPAAWSQDSAGVAGAAERGDRFATAMSSVLLTRLEDDDDSIWLQNLVTVPREDVGSVADAGTAYLGFAPGKGSIVLTPPVLQAGAGLDMVPMQFGWS